MINVTHGYVRKSSICTATSSIIMEQLVKVQMNYINNDTQSVEQVDTAHAVTNRDAMGTNLRLASVTH